MDADPAHTRRRHQQPKRTTNDKPTIIFAELTQADAETLTYLEIKLMHNHLSSNEWKSQR